VDKAVAAVAEDLMVVVVVEEDMVGVAADIID
jgi:hypothetical protein